MASSPSKIPRCRPETLMNMAVKPDPTEKMMFQLTLRRRGVSDQAVLRTMEEAYARFGTCAANFAPVENL